MILKNTSSSNALPVKTRTQRLYIYAIKALCVTIIAIMCVFISMWFFASTQTNNWNVDIAQTIKKVHGIYKADECGKGGCGYSQVGSHKVSCSTYSYLSSYEGDCGRYYNSQYVYVYTATFPNYDKPKNIVIAFEAYDNLSLNFNNYSLNEKMKKDTLIECLIDSILFGLLMFILLIYYWSKKNDYET